jgi:hypothetical protein
MSADCGIELVSKGCLSNPLNIIAIKKMLNFFENSIKHKIKVIIIETIVIFQIIVFDGKLLQKKERTISRGIIHTHHLNIIVALCAERM